MAKEFTVKAKFVADDQASPVIERLSKAQGKLSTSAEEIKASFDEVRKGAKDYADGLSAATEETEKLDEVVEQSVDGLDQAAKVVDRLNEAQANLAEATDLLAREFADGKISALEYADGLKRAAQQTEQLDDAVLKSATGLDSFRAKIGQVGSDIQSALSGKLASFFGVTAAIGFMTKAAKDAVVEFNEFSRSTLALSATLNAVGVNSRTARKEIIDWANAVEGSTALNEKQVLSLFSLAAGYTQSVAGARRLVEVSNDYAAGAGISVEQAVRQLAGTMTGTTEVVGRLVRRVGALDARSLKAGAAIELAGKQFEGFGTQITPLDATLSRLNSQLEDTQRAAGGIITQMPAVGLALLNPTTKAEFFTNALRSMIDRMRGAGEELDTMSSGADAAQRVIDQTTNAVNALAAAFGIFEKQLQNDIWKTYKELSADLDATLGRLGVTVESEVSSKLQDLEDQMGQLRDETDDGLRSWEEYSAGVAAIGAEIAAVEEGFSSLAEKERILADGMQDVADDTDDAARAVDNLGETVDSTGRSFSTSVRGVDAYRVAIDAAVTSLLKFAGAAARAKESQQVTLSQGGTRVRVEGVDGSRLLRPFGTSGNSQFGPGGLFPGLSGSSFTVYRGGN